MSKKILIIEDEEFLLSVLKIKLEKEGYAVLTSKDGDEGLNIIKSQKPDLVLMDILMPKKGGFEIMEEMAKNGGMEEIPVIVISNSGQPVEIDRAIKLGAKDFIIKTNFTPQDVLGKVEKFIGATPKSFSVAEGGIPAPSFRKDKGAVQAAARILIIEDDKFLRDLIVQKLSSEGFNIESAIDGEEGLKLIGKDGIELILLDLLLPGIDGFTILEKLKADKKTTSIPVLVLSNLGQREDIERAMKLGAEDFLVKANYTPNEIIEKVKTLLKKKYL